MGRLLTLFAGTRFTPKSVPSLALWLDPAYGVYKDGAAAFTGNVANYLSTPSAALNLASGFAVGGWLYSQDTANRGVVERGTGINTQWLLFVEGNRPIFRVIQAAGGTVSATGPTLSAGWHFLAGVHTGTAVVLYVDGVAVDSQPATAAANPGGNTIVGQLQSGYYPLNGRIDSLFAYAAPLTAGAVSALYNAGAGVTYSGLSAGQKTSLAAWWDLDEATGTRADALATSPLAATGTVGWDAGIAAGRAGDNDPASKWAARTGQIFAAPSLTTRPVYKVNNGRPYLQFDGVDDQLVLPAAQSAGFFTANTDWHVAAACNPNPGAGASAFLLARDYNTNRYGSVGVTPAAGSCSLYAESAGLPLGLNGAIPIPANHVFQYENSLSLTAWADGTPTGTSTRVNGTGGGDLSVGGRTYMGVPSPFGGRVSGLVVCAPLSAGVRNKLLTFLQSTY